ncbi:PucR family transcriptional regulator [Gordonia desulfuricans]|uniref:PucR family transcriptional regulator n=1 Tax=Gordonia desulfuricans TaxID=89051 RepID=A0A7K3LST7_9ACTN|nr:helix-turn-helix domain-containing protein [Gordonia desulfuricans]NDK91176.1 PucR family transcriptional regulator [Gordonia desulfuricans]
MTSVSPDPGAAAAQARLARVPAAASIELLEQVAAIAVRLREREPELVTDLTGMMAREIDQLDSDPNLVEMLHASVQGNVSTIIHVLANDIPIDHLQPTTAAVEYALRLAQRDVPSNSLVRAYHLGQNSVMMTCFEIIEELDLPADRAMAVTRHISDVMFGYIDWITRYVFQAYETERRRWLGADANVAAAAIRRLLDSPDADPRAFESETGYRLDQRHLAVIVWTDAADPRQAGFLDRVARELALAVRAESRPIITAIDRTTAWMWIPFGVRGGRLDAGRAPRIPPDVLPSESGSDTRVRAAIGLAGDGVTGFRRSHRQAHAAYLLASMPGSVTGQIVGFADRGIAVVSMLAQDLDATRAWAHEILGPLADDTPTAATLRETLAVFFATRESHLHTATQLNLHRNTVKYRVGKALAEVPPDRDRLDLALALTACELLGSAVIGTPS